MLNEKGERELAYVAQITDIRPIEGYDRVELVVVNDGWTCVVGKGQFEVGDLAAYFEIDSKLPARPPFSDNEFIKKKKYKITTQKMCKSISQGLIMSAADFGGLFYQDRDGKLYFCINGKHFVKGDFLTQELGVTYATTEDNMRKRAPRVNKYAKMAQRNPELAKTALWKFMYKSQLGKDILFMFFGRKKDKAAWPAWVVKTDEERIQNMPWILSDKEPWIVTEKIDGTSTTFTVHKRKHSKKYDFYVCSRNVVFDTDDKKCFYEENYYTKMAKQYKMQDILTKIAEEGGYKWVTIQGETFGNPIQKRTYHRMDQDFLAFNFITDREGRWNSVKAKEFLERKGVYWVPILDTNFILPDTLEEMLEYANGESILDFGMREGVVLRSQDGTKSFKTVSNEYLLKFHG